MLVSTGRMTAGVDLAHIGPSGGVLCNVRSSSLF